MILTPLQKLYNNEVDLGNIIVALGFEWLPKVQKIAQSGHTASYPNTHFPSYKKIEAQASTKRKQKR